MGTAISLTVVLKDPLRTRKIETIQREVETTLEELKRGQNELEMRILAELAMIGHRRRLLDELEKRQSISRSARAMKIDHALDRDWISFW